MGVFDLQECKPIILRVPQSGPYGESPLWAPLESGEPLAPQKRDLRYAPTSRKGVAGNRKSEGIPKAFGKNPVLTNSPQGMPRQNRIRGVVSWMSKHIIAMSETPKGECSLSRYGMHRGKEGTLTRACPVYTCRGRSWLHVEPGSQPRS